MGEIAVWWVQCAVLLIGLSIGAVTGNSARAHSDEKALDKRIVEL
jgi:hypothetical protein